MVEMVALAGGALAAGIGVYRYLSQNVEMLQPKAGASGTAAIYSASPAKPIAQTLQTEANEQSKTGQADLLPRTKEIHRELRHGFNTSSLSLGLASTGLLFPPVQYASVPILIYMGAPSARRAYDQLIETRKPSRALLETAALAICLGGGWYLIGSLGFWIYYVGRSIRHKRTSSRHLSPATWALPHSTRLMRGNEEAIVPTKEVQSGDVVLVGTSDIVPVGGIVIKGAAWVHPTGTTNVSAFCLKQIGDRVAAMDVIIAGELSLHVQKVQKI